MYKQKQNYVFLTKLDMINILSPLFKEDSINNPHSLDFKNIH